MGPRARMELRTSRMVERGAPQPALATVVAADMATPKTMEDKGAKADPGGRLVAVVGTVATVSAKGVPAAPAELAPEAARVVATEVEVQTPITEQPGRAAKEAREGLVAQAAQAVRAAPAT
jgi:hypothetical protein